MVLNGCVYLRAGIYTLHHHASSFPSPYSYDINRWITQQDENEEEERMRIRAWQRGVRALFNRAETVHCKELCCYGVDAYDGPCGLEDGF